MTISKENVLSVFLAFVVLWFGINEVLRPEEWVGYVPTFFSSLGEEMVRYMVLGHGIVLAFAGLAILFGWKRRLAAIVVALLLAQIIVTLFMEGGLNEVVVRDIGLLGMAIALSL